MGEEKILTSLIPTFAIPDMSPIALIWVHLGGQALLPWLFMCVCMGGVLGRGG